FLEVTLDRAPANAIDAATSRRMSAVFAEFATDDSLRVAILTGGGEKFFSAGWDLKAAAAGAPVDDDYGSGGFGGLTEFLDLHKPVIAAVNGMAVGGGFEIALACDLMVAADHALLWLPEAAVGVTPEPVGMRRLLARLPRAIALEMLYAGRRIGAEEGLALGLINRVVPGAELMDRAREMADAIIANAPLSISALKEMAQKTEHLSLAETVALQRAGGLAWYDRVRDSEDAREGPRAFAEKRAPVWRGR
ncbi:MAG: crotonobetainyl-CoA hydratase, partial [Proteobacteria bacterium]|nr:crotonobetainyl-CoA hydratase [Pseudomonadota bacterium]